MIKSFEMFLYNYIYIQQILSNMLIVNYDLFFKQYRKFIIGFILLLYKQLLTVNTCRIISVENNTHFNNRIYS